MLHRQITEELGSVTGPLACSSMKNSKIQKKYPKLNVSFSFESVKNKTDKDEKYLDYLILRIF